MSFDNEIFDKFKNYQFCLKIIVNSDEKTQEFFNNFGLSTAEFFRPFGVITGPKKIRFVSLNMKEKLISNFFVDFIDAKEFFPPKKVDLDKNLKEILTNFTPNLDIVDKVFNNYEKKFNN